MSDPLEDRFDQLRDLGRKDPPASLFAAASERASGEASSRLPLKNLIAVAACIAVAVVALAFTPPGRAATGWLADVAGVGEEPTVEQRDSVAGTARVLHSGTLADGSPFEVVIKEVTDESARVGGPGAPLPDRLCFQLEWPAANIGGAGGGCGDAYLTGAGNKYLSAGLYRPPVIQDSSDGPPEPDRSATAAIFMGAVPQDVRTVEAFAVDSAGNRRELQAELLTVDGEYLESVGGRFPVSFFFLPLDGTELPSGESERVTLSVYDGNGELVDSRGVEFPCGDCLPEDAPPLPAPG